MEPMKVECMDPIEAKEFIEVKEPMNASREANKLKQSFCEICQKHFSNHSNLKKHVKNYHPNEEIYLKSLIINGKQENRLCEICGKYFKKVSLLNRHTAVHSQKKKKSKSAIPNKKCALCDLYTDRQTLLDHYENYHKINLETDYNWFETLKEFFDWKDKYEDETNSFFPQVYNKTRDAKIYKGYQCDRSGNFQSNSKGYRRLKAQGSKKINGYCPAFISLKSVGSKFSVNIFKTHVGHDKEIDHLNLKKSERQIIADKIAMNIPFDDILEEFRVCESKSKRFRLLTRKDLHNIKANLVKSKKSSSVGHKGMTEKIIISDAEGNFESDLDEKCENLDKNLENVEDNFEAVDNKFENVDNDWEKVEHNFEDEPDIVAGNNSENSIDYKFETSSQDMLYIKSEDESEELNIEEPNNRKAGDVDKKKQMVFNNLAVLVQKVPGMTYKELAHVEKSISSIKPLVQAVKSSKPVVIKKIKFVRSKNIACQRKIVKIKKENVDEIE